MCNDYFPWLLTHAFSQAVSLALEVVLKEQARGNSLRLGNRSTFACNGRRRVAEAGEGG